MLDYQRPNDRHVEQVDDKSFLFRPIGRTGWILVAIAVAATAAYFNFCLAGSL